MGTTPIYGIYYDDPSDLALGRKQDEKQAATVEAALSAVEGIATDIGARAETLASDIRAEQSEAAEKLDDAHEKIADLSNRALLAVEAKTRGSYLVGVNFRSLPLPVGHDFQALLQSAGVPLAGDGRLLAAVEAKSKGIYEVGSNFRSLPLSAGVASKTDLPSASSSIGSAAGLKQIRVPLTAGHNPAGKPSYGVATVRYLARWNFPVARWRLRIRNVDIRSGKGRDEGADFSAVYVGKHDGAGGFSGEPVKALDSFALPDGGEEHVTAWSDTPLPFGAEGEVMFSLGYTLHPGVNSAPWPQCAGGWVAAGKDSLAGQQDADGFTRQAAMPFSVVVEVSVPETTPVVAIVGSSTSVGVGATYPVADAALSLWAQPRGIVAVMAGSSGDIVQNSQDLTAFKYARWLVPSGIDALIFQMGSNDISGGASAAVLQARTTSAVRQLLEATGADFYFQTVTPRNDFAGTSKETERQKYNGWLREGALGQIRVWEPDSYISDDGSTIASRYNAGDGIHFNTSGYKEFAKGFGVMTAPAPVYNSVWH